MKLADQQWVDFVLLQNYSTFKRVKHVSSRFITLVVKYSKYYNSKWFKITNLKI